MNEESGRELEAVVIEGVEEASSRAGFKLEDFIGQRVKFYFN